jgi:thioredoxin 2
MTEPSASAPRAVVPCAFCATPNRIDLTKLSLGPKCSECHRPMLLDRPIKVTEATYDRTLQGTDVPVLVDFYADWCGPCRMMAPAVDELARTSVGHTLVAKLDTDASQKVASRYQIRGIPTVIVFRNGREARRQSGVMPLAALREMVR